MLCGASDMQYISGQFIDLVKKFGFSPLCFINGSIHYSNYNSWEKNSILTVSNADILVYVILEKHGEITWNTEFSHAKNLGKPFIIFCLDKTYSFYINLSNDKNITIEADSSVAKIIKLLTQLDNEQRTIIPFQYQTFNELLHREIVNLLRESIKSLEKENQKNELIRLVKSKSNKDLKNYLTNEGDINLLKSILFDIFENKELRKRILDFFTLNYKLTDNEVIDLITDHEQGIRRKTLTLIKELTNYYSDYNLIFSSVIEVCKNYDDIGLINRAIPSLLETNLKLGIKSLNQYFPQKSSSTSQKLIYILKEKAKEILELSNSDEVFKFDVIKLINSATNLTESLNDWKNIANELLEKCK